MINTTDNKMMPTRCITALMITALLTSGCSLFGRSSATPAQPVKKIETAAPQPSKHSKDLTNAIAGEWVITAVGAEALQVEENVPYITFVPTENRFYASNGCNILNGDYLITSAGYLSFSNVATTMQFCADIKFEAEINQVLADNNTVSTEFENIGNESYLKLMSNGKLLLTLRRANMEYLNGQWQFVEINGEKYDDPEMNIFIDVAERKVHGNTGCNYFNGEVSFDHNMANAVSFTGMGVTRMACHKGDQERKLLVALEEASTALLGKNNTVAMYDNSGKCVLKLHRIEIGND